MNSNPQKNNKLKDLVSDRNFLKFIHFIENFVSKVLSIALIFVILFSLFELIILLSQQILSVSGNLVGFFSETLFEIFGLFLNILIALELLENITVYLRKHIVQLELVLITALIAVARKIIIFDPVKYQKVDLIALGIACLCLAISYWLIRHTNNSK
jgi:uncharacterized membrane protein (DUF373 family)